MLRIAICDDEFYFINEFSKLVKDRFENIEIVDKFTNPKELLNSNILYDVIFLDIDMPEIDGIEVAKAYDKKDTLIVFVTNKEALVFDAYNSTNSFGFIRKNKMATDAQSVFNRLKTELLNQRTLSVKNGSVITKVNFSDIIYIEKVVNKVLIHTKEQTYSTRGTIAEVEQILKSSCFVRCHIGFIVNLDYISLITSKDIKLMNSESIPLSRKNIKRVKEEFIKRTVMLSE
jgi:DNA-binding LytR/AlgR family response regulator